MEISGGADEASLEGRKKYYVIGRARYKNFKLKPNSNVNLIKSLPLSFENFVEALKTYNGGLTDQNYQDLNANFDFGEDQETAEENFEFGLFQLWESAVQSYVQSGYTGFVSDAHNLQLKQGGEFCYDVKLSRLMPKRIIDHSEDPTKEQILYSLKFLLLQFYERVPKLMEKLFDISFEGESKEDQLKKVLKLVLSENIKIGHWREKLLLNGISLKKVDDGDGGDGDGDGDGGEGDGDGGEGDGGDGDGDLLEELNQADAAEDKSKSESESEEEDAKSVQKMPKKSESISPKVSRHEIEEESPIFGGSKIKEIIRKVKGQNNVNAFGRNEDLENLTWYNHKGSIIGINNNPMYIRAHKYSKKMPELVKTIKEKHALDKLAVWIPPKSVGRADGYFKSDEVDYKSIMPWLLAFEVKGSENYDEPEGGKTDKQKMERLMYRGLSKEKFKTNLIENEGLRGGILIYI
jgi:hypothetical protein